MIRLFPPVWPASAQQSSSAGQIPSPDEMSGALREILAGSDFAQAPRTAKEQILGWISEMLNLWWERLLRFLAGEGNGLMEALAILVPLIALVALGFVALRRAPAWRGRTSGRGNEDGGSGRLPASALEWLSLARARSGRGDFRPAASALYRGFLLTLDEMGAVAFHPSKTPGDYARELADTGDGRSFLRSFQRFSFGQETPTTDGYRDLEALAAGAGCPAPSSDAEIAEEEAR